MYIKVVSNKSFFFKSKKIYETFRATGKAATCVGTTEQKLHHWNVLTEALNHNFTLMGNVLRFWFASQFWKFPFLNFHDHSESSLPVFANQRV